MFSNIHVTMFSKNIFYSIVAVKFLRVDCGGGGGVGYSQINHW